jgi:hypothetical protein
MVLRHYTVLSRQEIRCVLTYLWYMSHSKDFMAFWCFWTVLRNLTAYQMIGLRWGASQVPVNARNRSSHYPIWGLKSLIGPSSLPRSFVLYPDYEPPGQTPGGWIGSSPLLFLPKFHCQPNLGYPSSPPFLLFGLRSRTPASRWLRTIFQLCTIFYPVPGRCRKSRSSTQP